MDAKDFQNREEIAWIDLVLTMAKLGFDISTLRDGDRQRFIEAVHAWAFAKRDLLDAVSHEPRA